MPGQHALLSPSAAHRWMNCSAAPRLESQMPDTSSSYAEEGTLAHAYCAKKLKQFIGLPTDGEDMEIAQLRDRYHTGEMDEYTDMYKATVLEKFNAARVHTLDAMLLVETRLDFSDYVPEAFGTSDATIIADGCMEVIDFKYGKGVKVSAAYNPQMMIYALGAYMANCFEYRIDRVRMTIIQPRIDNISEFEMSISDLLEWGDTELRPKAKKAFFGGGDQAPGEWCRFCKVKSRCKALAQYCSLPIESRSDPKLLSPEEIAEILPQLPLIKTWASSLEEFALQQAVSGVAYPGFKVVEGRSVRKIINSDAVEALLSQEGYARQKYMKPQELRGISDLEKLIGKKRFAEICADYITRPRGAPTLAPIDDKRPAFNSIFDDFKDINTNIN